VTGVSFDTYTQSDYMTIKYNSSGLMDWEARYNGPDSAGDQASAIVRDSQGNIYVTGRSYAYGTYTPEYDYLTVKYNSQGDEEWAATYNGLTTYADDTAYDIEVVSGYIYVTGASDNASFNPENKILDFKYWMRGRRIAKCEFRNAKTHTENLRRCRSTCQRFLSTYYILSTTYCRFLGWHGPV